MLRDINTNRIPENILNLEQNFASKLPKDIEKDNPTSLVWSERGPNNVGGRTRALAGDVSNPNIIIAGGITGGIWRSANSGNSWTITTTNSNCIPHPVLPRIEDGKYFELVYWYG